MLAAMEVLVATELVVATRALRMADRVPSGAGVERLYAAAARALPGGLDDRRFGEEVEVARGLLGELAERPD
jgi:histidine ammonia-lyase